MEDLNDNVRVEYIGLSRYDDTRYYKVKEYVCQNNLNNSYPQYIDLTDDDSFLIMLKDQVCELKFDDDKKAILFFNVYDYSPELEFVAIDNSNKDLFLANVRGANAVLDNLCGYTQIPIQ